MSEEKVRVFNEKGIELFRRYLYTLGENPKAVPPMQLLNDPTLCAELGEVVKVEERSFTTRLEAAQYFSEVFSGVDKGNIDQNAGLWSWLSLYYFDQVCPPDAEGNRTPGRDYRHIPDRSYRYRHRHLLAGPYQVFLLYGDRAMLFLCTSLNKENKFHHELAGRQIFMSNPAIIETAHALFLDKEGNKPKAGSQAGGKPGTLQRFVDVMQQLDLTYDLYSMSPEQLLSLLPAEFDGWKGTT